MRGASVLSAGRKIPLCSARKFLCVHSPVDCAAPQNPGAGCKKFLCVVPQKFLCVLVFVWLALPSPPTNYAIPLRPAFAPPHRCGRAPAPRATPISNASSGSHIEGTPSRPHFASVAWSAHAPGGRRSASTHAASPEANASGARLLWPQNKRVEEAYVASVILCLAQWQRAAARARVSHLAGRHPSCTNPHRPGWHPGHPGQGPRTLPAAGGAIADQALGCATPSAVPEAGCAANRRRLGWVAREQSWALARLAARRAKPLPSLCPWRHVPLNGPM